MAPEIIYFLNQKKCTGNYNPFKSDIYSLGLCILDIFDKETPLTIKDREKENNIDPRKCIEGPNDKKLHELIQKTLFPYKNEENILIVKKIEIVLKHMLWYNFTFRPDFLGIYSVMKNFKLMDLDKDIENWVSIAEKRQKTIIKKNSLNLPLGCYFIHFYYLLYFIGF